MALKSVATKQPPNPVSSSEHELYLNCGRRCLTVTISREHKSAPPDTGTLEAVHTTLRGLGKATQIIASLLEGGEIDDEWSTGLALSGISDSIVLHATLAEAMNAELSRVDTVATDSEAA